MVNLNPKRPGAIQTFDGQAQIGGVPSAATYSGQAWEALTRVAGGLSDKLGQMADEAVKRESEVAALNYAQGLNGQDNAASYQQQQAAGVAADAAHGKGPWMEQAKAILRKEEGFRDTPYYDTNAHRVGYGSDTTIVNGKPVRVTPGMKITQDQAEQDLTYRLTSQEGARVASQVGDGWATLPDNVKAGLASVGYNYGSLPDPVVSAARSGDPAKIAAAVAALDANPKRRQREAAIIAGTSGAPAGTAPATTPQFTAGQKLMQPLPLRRDGTIAGEAWDRAVSSAYSWRMQEALSNDLHAAYIQNQDNPQGYAEAMADLRSRYQQNPNLSDPYLSETFNRAFTEKSDGYAQAVAAKHEQRLRAEQEASFAAGMESNRVEIEQQAIALGASPQGDAIIGRQVQRAQSALDQAVDAGTVTPAFAEAKKKQIAETAIRGRVQGVYEALPTPEAKKQYALKLLEDKVAGKGPLTAVDYATVKALSDTLFADAQGRAAKQQSANLGETVRVGKLVEDDIQTIAQTGKGLDTSAGLNETSVRTALGEAEFLKWQEARSLALKKYSATADFETRTAAQIAQQLDMLKPGTTAGVGSADAAAVYEAAQAKAKAVLEERKLDPLGQASRAGAVQVQPIDATDPQRLADSLKARASAQATTSQLYGQPAPFFRPGEKEALSATLATNPAALSSFAQGITQTLGNRAVQVLGELSPEAPVLAHTAALTAITGSNAVADEVSATLVMKQKKMLTAKMPSEGDMGTFAAQTMGGALSGNTEARAAIVQTANILYESMANTYGFDATDLKTAGSPAQVAYAQALDRAAGGRTVNGKKFGGLGDIDGMPIVVPPNMEKDEPERLISNLSDEHLTFLPPLGSMSGYRVTAADVRKAYVVSVGNGIFRFAMNDPQSPEPRWLGKPNGTAWELDIQALRDLQSSVPGNGMGLNPFGWNINK